MLKKTLAINRVFYLLTFDLRLNQTNGFYSKYTTNTSLH